MLHQVATLNSSMSIGDALKRLELYADDDFVVVSRREGQARYWYYFPVGQIRYSAGNSSNWPDKMDTPLKIVLDLHEYTAKPTIQASEVSSQELQFRNGVMLDGEIVLGVLEQQITHSAADHVTTAGVPGREGATALASNDQPESTAPEPAGQDDAVPASSQFSAFPRLQSPDGVAVDTPFELAVKLTTEMQSGRAGAIVIDHAPSIGFDLLVQLIAPGFEAPSGTQRILHVDRHNLEANEVTFKLVANGDIGPEPRIFSLEIQFSYNAEVCGRAWRDITVVPAGMSAAGVPEAASGSSPLSTPGAGHAPDLTVSITEADEDGHFIWLFTSPHPVNLFKERQIETRLKNDNARSFAVKVLKGIPAKDGSDLVGMHMKGTSREIAQAMPTEFWLVLGEVWSLVHAQGRVPTLLFLSAEPYVPWELASVEDEYIDPALLDSAYTSVLNAQARVGRWLPPRPHTPRGGDRPHQPPAIKVGVKNMAVVTGDYLAIQGIRPLPEAEAEGDQLCSQYQAIRMKATWNEVESLLENRVQKNGQQVDIELMHFACHGQVDPLNPQHNGIVLNGMNMRLDPTTARGNTIGAATQPFAFMNACEVGSAGETLGAYGGMAAAFLNEGFRGFVAPLWAVNDKLAHQAALKFYQKTLVEQEPVSEALRSIRLDYDPDAPMPSATCLAYIFYGHPDLLLEH